MLPPRFLRFRIDDDGLGATLRTPWTSLALYAGGAFWNLGMALFVRSTSKPTAWPMVLAAAIFFGLLFLRLCVNRTTIRFENGLVRCISGPIFPCRVVEHDLASVEGFAYSAVEGDPKQGHRIYLETRTGARIELPMKVDGTILTVRGFSESHVGAAPPGHFDFLCASLARALEDARRQ